MKNTKLLLGTAIFLFAALILLTAQQFTEHAQQAERLASVYQVFPVPIPSDLSFAEEKVPLDKFGIKERLDRELLVNTYWQSNTMLILKRSKKYFKIIEPILEANGIPDDFKYLAVAESGLQVVQSPAGANGIWQFMESSGKYYGLEINDEVDERLNLKLSTEAACRYLKLAYEEFGNWTLAAAAYNRGINGINADLNKQQVNSYYDLHLNSETSRYIMRILAFKILLEDPDSYGFNISTKDYYGTTKAKEIQIAEGIENLSEYAKSIGTNYHILKSLNPWIKGNTLANREQGYLMSVPI